MNFKSFINIAGCIATIGMGSLGFFFPESASKLTGLEPTNLSAFAEFRGTFGGAFLAMGIMPLIVRVPLAYLISGFFWWGAAIGRIVSLFADGGFNDPKNFGGLVLEVVIGLLLVVGNLQAKNFNTSQTN